jgi:1-acyl-sn-glycerol-3-phosphate acyltransferase
VKLVRWVVNAAIKRLMRLVCRVDSAQLERVPAHGPLILVANHVNFLETPIVYTHLQPRRITGFVKAESWNNLLLGILFTFWDGIPLSRQRVDMSAMRLALSKLDAGHILAIAPEGTRSGDGRLQRGFPGVVMLALRGGVPVLPLGHYGVENYRRDWARLRRPEFHIAVGRPFHLDPGADKVTGAVRQQMVDEIMFQIAGLLPPAYRGFYSDTAAATERYLRFVQA